MVVDYVDKRLRDAHSNVMEIIHAITESKHSWNSNWDFADNLVIIYIDDADVRWNILIDLLLLNDGDVQYLMTVEKNRETHPLRIGKLSAKSFGRDFKELYEIAV